MRVTLAIIVARQIGVRIEHREQPKNRVGTVGLLANHNRKSETSLRFQ